MTVSDYVVPQMRPFLDQLWRCGNIAMNRQEAKIFVGGLNWSTSEEKLRSYFENFGSVQEAFVSYDRHTGRPRGFGFVVFEDPLVADKVVSIQHTIDRREVTLSGELRDLPARRSLGSSSNPPCPSGRSKEGCA